MGALATAHYDVLERIAQARPLGDVLGSIVDMVAAESSDVSCSILLYDPDERTLRPGATSRLPEEYVRALAGLKAGPKEASSGAAAFLGVPVISADISTDPNWHAYRDLALPHGLRSCWSLPIKTPEGEVLGTFDLYHATPALPGDADFAAAEVATHAAAIAIMRNRFDDSLRQSESRARHLARLYSMSSAINEALARLRQPAELYRAACQIAVEKGMARLAWVCTYETDLRHVRTVARFGRDEGYIDALTNLLDSAAPKAGFIAQALRAGQASIINDIEGAPAFAFKELALAHGLRSLAVFPLDIDSSTHGVLAIGAEGKGFFQDEEVDVLTALAADLSFAVHSAIGERERVSLVDALGRRVQELTGLHKVSRLLDAEPVLDHAALGDLAGSLLPAFPRAEAVRIRLGETLALAGNWPDAAQVEEQAFGAFGVTGSLEVACPRREAGPSFSAEEGELVRSVAQMLARYLRRTEAEAQVKSKQTLLAIAGRFAKLGGILIELHPWRIALSDESCAMLDLPPGSTLGQGEALAFLQPEHRERAEREFWAAVEAKSRFDTEVEVVTKTGRQVWLRIVGEAALNDAGRVVQIHGALQDVTERQQLEQQFRHAQKMEAVGTLAGGVAHDFNNILSVILSYSQLAAMPLESEHPVRADLREIEIAARRASELTRQLLAFSRQGMMKPRVLDLNEVLYGMEKMLKRLVGADVDIVVAKGDGLGKVFADRGQLEQVLMNLVVNARDAMPRGGRIQIETSNVEVDQGEARAHVGLAPGPHVVMSVKDDGTGMDAATKQRIFEPFFTTKDQGKGTGLGLSTVWGIVTQSGGHVRVDSELGVGTTFRVYLPREQKRTAEQRAVSQGPSVRPGGPETILVAEDDAQLRVLTARVLSERGYRVLSAESGEEALALAHAHQGPIHLLLTDVVMPKVNGIELVRELGATRPELKVLFVSGYTREAVTRHGSLLAERDFLPKPVTPDQLLARVRAVLDS